MFLVLENELPKLEFMVNLFVFFFQNLPSTFFYAPGFPMKKACRYKTVSKLEG